MIPQGFIAALIRYVVLYGLGWLAARNVITSEFATSWSEPLTEWFTNGIVTFGMVAWLWARKRRQELEQKDSRRRIATLSELARDR